MKKLFLIAIIASLASTINAQNIRLNAYGSYIFDDKVDNGYTYNTNGFFSGTVKGGFLWGGGLEFRLHDYYGLELLYQRLDTHAPVNYWDYADEDTKYANVNLGVSYLMLAGTRSMQKPGSKAEPYGGLMLGMAFINADNPETGKSNDAQKFAWGARLGTNIWASDKVGIKLQMQFLSVPQGAGGGLYFGTGGVGAGVSTYSTIFQFVLGGGLTFKLGQHSTHQSQPVQ